MTGDKDVVQNFCCMCGQILPSLSNIIKTVECSADDFTHMVMLIDIEF